jgi:hypothetical protein
MFIVMVSCSIHLFRQHVHANTVDDESATVLRSLLLL